MKNKFSLLLASVFLISLMASLISATDIAYVVKNTNFIEQGFIEAINELGYTYELVDDSDVSSTDFSRYNMILIGDENIRDVPVSEFPSLIANPRYYEDWSRTYSSVGADQPLKAFVFERDISITQGIPMNFQVYTQARYNGHSIPMHYLYGTKYNTSPVVTRGRSVTDLTKYVIAVKENPRRVFFGITESEYWTQESKTLFMNSIAWIIEENGAPVFNGPIPDLTWQDGSYEEIDLDDYFQPSHEGETLSYFVYNTSENQEITLEVDEHDNSLIKFTSKAGWMGTDWIIFGATNGRVSTISNLINLIVTQKPVQNPNAPSMNSIADKIIEENSLLEFTISATDSNASEQLTFSVKGLPQGASFTDNNDRTATFSWTPTSSQVDVYFLTFKVENSQGLSDEKTISIRVTEIQEPPEFSDVDLCQEITNQLKIKIKDPDDKEEFFPGETISGEIEIRNNAEEDLEVELEIHLYDLDEDESIEDIDDSIDVDEGDKETLDFELEIPSDIKNKNFILLVLATANEEKEYCNYEFINLKIEREKADVRLKDIEMSEFVSSGQNIQIRVEVENLGTRDQDVYIEIENLELNIKEQTEEFELENYEDDNRKTKTFEIQIPEDAEEKEYTLRATVYFDEGDEEDSKEITFTIGNRLISSGNSNNINNNNSNSFQTISLINYQEKPTIRLSTPVSTPTPASKKQVSNKTPSFNFSFNLEKYNQDQLLLIIDLLLAIGILIEIILLVIIRRRNYY